MLQQLKMEGALIYYEKIREEEYRESGGLSPSMMDACFHRMHTLTWPFLVKFNNQESGIHSFSIIDVRSGQKILGMGNKHTGGRKKRIQPFGDRSAIRRSIVIRNEYFQQLDDTTPLEGYTPTRQKQVDMANRLTNKK